MKRMHVHVSVEDIAKAVGFYSALFAAKPAVMKHDYAKWMLDDPRVNFAISTRGREPGLDHLGIQAERADELQEVYACLRRAGGAILEQGNTTCCCPVREIVDYRSRRNFVGDVPHHWRGHALRHQHSEGRADRTCKSVLRAEA